MSVIVNDVEVNIIDRTLMAIGNEDINVSELVEFFRNLKKVGVDFFEVDEKNFQLIKEILKLENYIFRVEKRSHLEVCNQYSIDYIIVDENNVKILEELKLQKNKKFKILLEINYDDCNEPEHLNRIKEIVSENSIYSVRFNGIDTCFFHDFSDTFSNIRLNVYASDKLHMATAVGFEAALKGFNSITTAFGGRDGKYGTSALEEVLVSLKVIENAVIKGETEILSLMREQYEKLTYKQLLWNKPIIGKNIFVYESGVHAMGIDKNPETYEPFKPELVGQERRLALGKHSSRNSIILKLNEFSDKFDFSDNEVDIILMEVKRISILKKAEVSNENFIDICTRIEACRYV